jgi:hypothetical protein
VVIKSSDQGSGWSLTFARLRRPVPATKHCRVVYQNGSRFENDEPTFQIHQLPGVGRSRRYGVWAGELRDVFQGERTTPRFIPFTSGAGLLTNADMGIVKAMQIDRRDPLVALGEHMSAAETALRQLERRPQDETARHTYNFTVGRIIATIRDAKLDPLTEPLRVPASGGEFVLTHKPDPRPQWNPALYDFTPADQFDVHGTYVTERTTRDGIGAPVVAVGREANKEAHANFSLSRIYYGVTAIARFDGRRCVLSFEDPLAVETVRMDGQIFPLAADFAVPLAVMLASTNPKKLELTRLLNPAKYAETARISRLQPYDPNKTVVLVIHGLMDSPATWAPMLNRLRGYEEIRRNYQFWFYSYPSGYPYPYSAA